jgi:hypothetical protein
MIFPGTPKVVAQAVNLVVIVRFYPWELYGNYRKKTRICQEPSAAVAEEPPDQMA